MILYFDKKTLLFSVFLRILYFLLEKIKINDYIDSKKRKIMRYGYL